MPLPCRVPDYRRATAGITLIELMLALAIGSFVVIGAVSVLIHGRASFRINESVARLQENARYVFDVIEPDIRMARFRGLTAASLPVTNAARAGEPVSVLAPANDCGSNWTVDLDADVAASNGSYAFDCPAYGSAAAGTDTLVVRRASARIAPMPYADKLYLLTTRSGRAILFAGPDLPEGSAPMQAEVREHVVNGYYVSRNSSLDTPGEPMPSLRRKFLRSGSGGPVIADEEILPGVEDLQIEFGIHTDRGASTDPGSIDRYVNPDDPILDPAQADFDAGARVLAVRVWLRLRAASPQAGIPQAPSLAYADRDLPPFTDGLRRLLVSKTIFIRNAR